MKVFYRRTLAIVGIIVMLMPLVVIGGLHLLRPRRTNWEQEIFSGMYYQRQIKDQPRPILMHLVTVDLKNPEIKFLVTPGKTNPQQREFIAQTTTEFLQAYSLQLAINGSLFTPFHTRFPWDYYPRSGDGVDVEGLVISQGKVYSEPKYGWPVLCILYDNRLQINPFDCPENTQSALAGTNLVVTNGEVVEQGKDMAATKLYPRTAVAIDGEGKKLWLLVIDGRQPGYSEGVTLEELGQILLELGAFSALNLDGGGSTTMAIEDGVGVKILNSPIHTRIPLHQRPVANHLGIYSNSSNE